LWHSKNQNEIANLKIPGLQSDISKILSAIEDLAQATSKILKEDAPLVEQTPGKPENQSPACHSYLEVVQR